MDEPATTPESAPSEAPVESSASASTSAVESAPSQGAEGASSEFDWSGWNGEVDSLPETQRENGGHIYDHFSRQFAEKEADVESLRTLYSAMLDGEEDPRIRESATELDKIRGELEGKDSKYSDLQGEFSKFRQETAQAYVAHFWERNAALKDDSVALGKLNALLRTGFDGDSAVALIGLGGDAQEIAEEALKNGVPAPYAVKLAKAHSAIDNAQQDVEAKEVAKAKAKKEAARKKASKPRPAAKITHGATTSTTPNTASRSINEAKSLDEMRSLAARRALRVVGGK